MSIYSRITTQRNYTKKLAVIKFFFIFRLIAFPVPLALSFFASKKYRRVQTKRYFLKHNIVIYHTFNSYDYQNHKNTLPFDTFLRQKNSGRTGSETQQKNVRKKLQQLTLLIGPKKLIITTIIACLCMPTIIISHTTLFFKNTIFTLNQKPPKTVTLNDLLTLSEKINQLPVAEVLNAIDMLITELPPFLEKYEFNAKMTWKVWLKKYWWVPPIFGAWFGLKILLRLQKPYMYFSPYNVPKPPINLPPLITTDPALLEIRQSKIDH